MTVGGQGEVSCQLRGAAAGCCPLDQQWVYGWSLGATADGFLKELGGGVGEATAGCHPISWLSPGRQ